MKKGNLEKYAFIASAAIIVIGGSFAYGVLAHKGNLFPLPYLRAAWHQVAEVVNPSDKVLETIAPRHKSATETLLPNELQPGLILVAADVVDRETAVRVIDRSGRVIHEWLPIWSEVWPDDEGDFPEGRRPEEGMFLHGIQVLPDASIVTNFEYLSTFKMDVCGTVEWKLDNLGHHSVHYARNGTLWVSAEDYIEEGPTGYPDHVAPIRSWILQNLSTDGEVLQTIPVFDVLIENGLEGLLYMSSLWNSITEVSGDTLHLNDVETFPAGWKSEIFEPGDLLISLRNINTILVIDAETKKVKFISIGRVMRQHDPDFMPGDKISVFDNRSFTTDDKFGPSMSRVVEFDARTGEATTVLAGDGKEPFFTHIMGVHQRLENGNILVVPSDEGRVLEFTPDGRLAWRYDNRVEPDMNRRTYMAMVLPAYMDEAFFRERSKNCKK